MRLITLEFSGIGPFAGQHTIDFSRFDASGLFLMRGATGSGKSTIIDALTFALYGTVAGGRATSSMDRMRSDYAAPKTPSFVKLLFEVNSGFYEVVRSPSYLKEGNKHPTPATAVLEKVTFDDDKEVSRQTLTSRIREVNTQVARIVGIGEDQFLQTVVLPQGKFAEFIRSAPAERKAVLQEIFRTDNFEVFTDKLRSRAREALEEYDHQLTLTEHAGMSLSTDIAGLCSLRQFDEAASAAKELESIHIQKYESLIRTFEKAQANRRELAATQAENRRIIEARKQWEILRKEHEKLDAERPEVDNQRIKLTQARNAQAVAVAIEAQIQARQESERREEEYLACIEALGDERVRLQLDDADSPVPHSEMLSTIIDELSETIADLTRANTTEKSLASHHQRAEELTKSIAKLTQKREPLAATLIEAPSALAKVKEQIADMKKRVEGLEAAREQVRNLDTRLGNLDAANELREKLLTIADKIVAARKEQARCEDVVEKLEQRWRDNYAASLARHLEEGSACPVCGSATHPAPASTEVEEVTAESLEAAGAALATANTEVGKALAEQTATTRRIAELNDLVGADRGTLELSREHAGNTLAALEAIDEQLQGLSALYEQAQEDFHDDRTALNELDVELTAQRLEQETINKAITDETAQVERLRASYETVGARLLAITEQRERIRRVQRALEARTNARDSLATASQHLKKALKESQFSSAEQACAASLPREEMDDLNNRITDFDQRSTRIVTRLDDLEKADLYARQSADPTALARTVDRVSAQFQNAQEAVISHREGLKQLRKEIARLTESIDSLRQIEESTGPIRRLAELASGATIEGGHRVPLSTWVLMSRFEDVLAAANPYLAQFSSGRYELRRVSVDLGSSQQIAGLGLAVYDFETDSLRPPKSLSGGETFYASLALALGLVEVVSSEAGGIEFRTMLIDEGFGHLDQSTLDQVMQGLEHLRDTGRTVGIVSHVEEMRRRIHDGIVVSKLPEGGSTLVVVG
ncbi:MAG: SMC family ATPase [Actinomycetaceae bacterium]|nr:SMC family ATPase [Actinomycetaceae bacterium]